MQLTPSWASRDAERIGERVGAYRLVRELGHGGMGVFYLEYIDGQTIEAHREQGCARRMGSLKSWAFRPKIDKK